MVAGLQLEMIMTSPNQGFAPLLQTACALVSTLLLISVLGYAIIVGPGTEIAAEEGGEIGVALRGIPSR
jgi:hypothetical protein